MTGLLSVAQHGQVISRTCQPQLLVIADPTTSSKIDLQWKTALKFVEIRRRNLMYCLKLRLYIPFMLHAAKKYCADKAVIQVFIKELSQLTDL